MKDMIEKMQKNEKPFGLLEPEEKEFMRSLPKDTTERYTGSIPDGWIKSSEPHWFRSDAYHISPDYKPEPEIERCEVEPPDPDGNIMFRQRTGRLLPLAAAAYIANYIECEYEGGLRSTKLRLDSKNKNKPALIPKFVLFAK